MTPTSSECGLRVEDGTGRAGRAADALAVGQGKGAGEALGHTGLRQAQEPAVNGGPRREVQRQVPPRAAGAQDVLDAVQDCPQRPASRTTDPRWLGQKRRDERPLRIGQAACIRQVLTRKLGAGGGCLHRRSRVSVRHSPNVDDARRSPQTTVQLTLMKRGLRTGFTTPIDAGGILHSLYLSVVCSDCRFEDI